MDPDTSSDLNVYFAAARLREEVSFELARTETAHAADLVRRTFPGVMPVDNGLTVERLQAVFVRDVRPALLLLWAAVTVVLLIACANTVNLLLVRASVREREMAIRVATGASAGRILRQLLTESVTLAIAGGGVGLVVGAIGTRVLLSIQAWNLPSVGRDGSRVTMDVHVLAYTLITSVGIGVAFGVVPALRAMRVDVDDQLKTGSRGRSDTSAHSVRSGVVVVEVALALMLLVGAALLIRSFVAVRRVEPGFDTHRVLTMQTALIGRQFASGRAVSGLVTDALQRLEALPDVEVAASTLTGVPLDAGAALNVSIVGRSRNDEYDALGWNVVSPEYFDALTIPLLRGRLFTNRDGQSGAPVVLINEAMARRYWSGSDPLRDALVIAPRIGGDIEETVPRRIIGVVGDVRHQALRQDPRASTYVPIAQVSDRQAAFFNRFGVYLTWIVRTRGEPHRIADVIQNEIRTASGGLPPARVRSMDQVSAASTGQSQHQMWVTTTFSAVAMLLAAVGLYGVMSYSVEQRRREIGIRLALGADVKQVRQMILAQGMKLTGFGIAGGIAAALGLTRVLAGFLFGVGEHDPLVFVGVPLLLCAVAVAAMWIPARSASSVDPMTALRAE
jgi:predicted permease